MEKIKQLLESGVITHEDIVAYLESTGELVVVDMADQVY